VNTFRYRLGRRLRALAKRVEPTVVIDWDRECRLLSTMTVTDVTTTWPLDVNNPHSGGTS
jgi:hypothetical protein